METAKKYAYAVIGIYVMLLGLVLYDMAEKAKKNTKRVDAISEVQKQIKAVQDNTDDRWRGQDQRKWADELQRLNPDLKMPK